MAQAVGETLQESGEVFDATAEQKKAYKRKAGLWSQSHPLPRLLLLTQVMSIVRPLQIAFFHFAGAAFQREQDVKAARGEKRTYKVLEVALGRQVHAAFMAVCQEFEKWPAPFPLRDQNLTHRSLAFRLLSRCGCALHQIMRSVHRGHPYRIFRLLESLESDLDGLRQMATTPPCLRESFSDHFLSTYGEATDGSAAQVFLESAASLVEIDIASMEARHAMNRGASISKSLQTWTVALETLNMSWTTRQACRRRPLQETPAKKLGRPCKQQDQEKKKSGGGGGPYRAWLHVNYAGMRGSRALWSTVAKLYRQISPEEKEHYRQLGRQGTLAWQQSRQNPGPKQRGVAFGLPLPRNVPSTAAMLPNLMDGHGIVVAGDAPRAQALVPRVACEFETGLKMLNSEQRAAAKQAKTRMDAEDEQLRKHSEAVLQKVPSMMSGVHSADLYVAACSGGCSTSQAPTRLDFDPPSVDFAAVAWCGFESFAFVPGCC